MRQLKNKLTLIRVKTFRKIKKKLKNYEFSIIKKIMRKMSKKINAGHCWPYYC